MLLRRSVNAFWDQSSPHVRDSPLTWVSNLLVLIEARIVTIQRSRLALNSIPLLKILSRWVQIPSNPWRKMSTSGLHNTMRNIPQVVLQHLARAQFGQALLWELSVSVAFKVRPYSCELHIWATHCPISSRIWSTISAFQNHDLIKLVFHSYCSN